MFFISRRNCVVNFSGHPKKKRKENKKRTTDIAAADQQLHRAHWPSPEIAPSGEHALPPPQCPHSPRKSMDSRSIGDPRALGQNTRAPLDRRWSNFFSFFFHSIFAPGPVNKCPGHPHPSPFIATPPCHSCVISDSEQKKKKKQQEEMGKRIGKAGRGRDLHMRSKIGISCRCS